MTSVRPLAASAAALATAGVLIAPIPAVAAPAPCARAEFYAAQAGAELLRLNRLDLRPTGRTDRPITDLGLADAQSALVANGRITSAAAGRMLDATGAGSLSLALLQQSPPTHPNPSTRTTRAGMAGPFTLDAGALSSHARWAPGMACAAEEGQATRAATSLRSAALPGSEDAGGKALVSVRRRGGSESTTALRGIGVAARSVATATAGARTIDLLGGAVHLEIERTPVLTASIGGRDGAAVAYRSAIVAVSGRGIDPARLDSAGDYAEITLGGRAEARSGKPGPGRSVAEVPLSEAAKGPWGKSPAGRLSRGSRLPIPVVPGIPVITGAGDEAATVPESGSRLRISLGEVRQVTSGHAVAARVTGIKILLTQAAAPGKAKGLTGTGGVVLDLDVGRLEAAAVAPGSVRKAPSSGLRGAVFGGGLPITGPRAAYFLMIGLALLVLGAALVAFGTPARLRTASAGRGRRNRP